MGSTAPPRPGRGKITSERKNPSLPPRATGPGWCWVRCFRRPETRLGGGHYMVPPISRRMVHWFSSLVLTSRYQGTVDRLSLGSTVVHEQQDGAPIHRSAALCRVICAMSDAHRHVTPHRSVHAICLPFIPNRTNYSCNMQRIYMYWSADAATSDSAAVTTLFLHSPKIRAVAGCAAGASNVRGGQRCSANGRQRRAPSSRRRSCDSGSIAGYEHRLDGLFELRTDGAAEARHQ